MQDRNFDDLAPRFKRNVYGTLKGRVRLAVLERDFREYAPELYADSPLDLLDLGAGQAPFSLQFAQLGHRLVLADISSEMLAGAQLAMADWAAEHRERVHAICHPLQQLAQPLRDMALPSAFDVVICHAVLEWLAEPDRLYSHLANYLKPGGMLSLTFYNINGLAFKNLLRTNFHKFDIDNFRSFRGSLTPTHPQEPHHVLRQLSKQGFEIVCRSGIRVFHDYILDPVERNREPEAIVGKELEYSRRESFWPIARYIHVLGRKV
ncbi:SAM-dependent methyltransferase [Teredinibacter turnerae T7901]|uniref:tRNA 5-carboxymethoxyuridine methyltransferase n=1 Tax=Teredinibacter turnerae (strain ATCC 39867 / T7901) TaxID=377629 RepID=C5BHU7_TERTT|nr:methyltransferase [Teredinibacter turnerae]ACR14771.1 SAM-dependent methyltransferase [Teredinibacter turnerae T7901]